MAGRKEVLRCYRLLQKTCRDLFRGDHEALEAARRRVREEFWKHRHITNQEEISQLITEARETEQFLRQNVVQGVHTGNSVDVYRVRMREDTVLAKNASLPQLDSQEKTKR